jgi:hypothetical protein
MLMLIGVAFCASLFLRCANEESVAPLEEPGQQGPPSVVIDKPPLMTGEQQYGTVVRFDWRSDTGEEPVAVRQLFSLVVDTNGTYYPPFDIVKDLNDHPERYEEKWSRWIAIHAPGDSGRSTILGDDETLTPGKYYIFAVQARDSSNRTTETFNARTNVRRFKIISYAEPFLTIYEPNIGAFKFIGEVQGTVTRSLPPGIPLRFTWQADVENYGGELEGCRYGWDIPDVSAWDAPFERGATAASEAIFNAGFHTLFVEAVDLAGSRSLGCISLTIVPFPMDRNLLFVDDYYSGSDVLGDYREPNESAHDAFWLHLCSQADGFDPARDVYDSAEHGFHVPPLDLIGRYKNVIWTYSASSNAWNDMVYFTPESLIGKAAEFPINYISMFLRRGGHLWTLGQTLRAGGGLSACLPPGAQVFPMNLACEIAGNRDGCDGDRSGVNSMPYRDYCVTMLDKVDGIFRRSRGMPERIRDWHDCMTSALRDDSDPITGARPGFPKHLDLWEEVTKPGRYLDPNDSLGPGGLTYVEVYDPEYWMEWKGVASQPCFHPLYRMRAKADSSALDYGTVALWVTKYEHVVPEVSSGVGVGAPSFHFGFPLWFFRRSSADSIAGAVFDEWGIRKPD